MQGLRKYEGEKFENFFRIVQAEAKKMGYIFYLDNAEAKLVETEEFECCDMHGWLILPQYAEIFEREIFYNKPVDSDFDNYYTYVDFDLVDGKIKVIFEDEFVGE